MKKSKLLLLIATCFCSVLLLSSYGTGVFTADHTGNSGLAGGGASCGSCHGGISAVDTNIMRIRVLNANNIPTTYYSTGATYTVEIRLKTNAATKAGFQCVAAPLFGNGNAGTITNNLMPNNVQIWTNPNGYVFASHTGNGSVNVIANGYATWRYTWVAPSTNVGAITIGGAGNITNNNNQNSGDTAVQSNVVLQAPNSIANIAWQKGINVASVENGNYVTISQKGKAEKLMVHIVNAAGKIVVTKQTNEITTENISLQHLPAGIYAVILSANKNTLCTKIMKQ